MLVLAAATAIGAEPQRPVEGNPTSTVRVVIYEDLQCSDCAAFRRMLDDKLLPRYGERVAFEHRDFPLAKHAWARRAAVAARFFSARDSRLGLEYRRDTMARQAEITADNFEQQMADFSRRHQVDPAAARRALDDPVLAGDVQKDYEEGVARGVSHTPTAFVNGRPFVESFTLEEISKGIDEALGHTH